MLSPSGFVQSLVWTIGLALGAATSAALAQGVQVMALDPAFPATFDGSVAALAQAADGKIYVGGAFTRVNGAARVALARLNADGTLDASFAPSFESNFNTIAVTALALQGDGRLVLAGNFTRINGSARARVARMQADGTLDNAFVFPASSSDGSTDITRIVPLSGGRVLLGGNFATLAGQTRLRLARLLADGTLDPDFVPFTGSTGLSSFFLTDVFALPDDRVVYGNDGTLSSGGVKAPVLGRLLANGAVDSTFTAGVIPALGTGLQCLAPLADGRFFIGGNFTSYQNANRNRIALLAVDGTLASQFVPTSGSIDIVSKLVPLPDGRLYAVRRGGLAAVARLSSSGEEDARFTCSITGGFGGAAAALLLSDGNLLLGGTTFAEGATERTGLIRTRLVAGPIITRQPVAVSTLAGAAASLSVTLTGADAVTYQWFKDGAAIDGAQQPALSLTPVQAANTGSYFVRITHAGGSVDSAATTVVVTSSAPVLSSTQPLPLGFGSALRAGTRFAMTAPALAAGSTPLSYQWFKDGVALPGETGDALFRAEWTEGDSGSYHVTITNSLGAITSGATYQAATSSEDWDWLRPLPQGNALTTVQYLNGMFLTGGARGTILQSGNGQEWTLRRAGISGAVGPFAFGNGTFVALIAAGGVVTSPDGATWTRRETGLTDGRALSEVTFADGRFVAVGTKGTVLTSVNGTTWTAVTPPTADGLSAVAFGGGRWLALSSRSRIYTSTDATRWTAGAVLPEPVGFLAHGAGLFVTLARASNAIYTSPDGATWTLRAYGGESLAARVSLQYTDAGFLAATGTTAGRFIASTDGINWTERTLIGPALNSQPTSITSANAVYVMTAGVQDPLLVSTGGGGWTRVGTGEGRAFRALATNGDMLVAVGTAQPPIGPATSPLVMASSNGTDWTAASLSTTRAFNDVAWGPAPANLFVAVGAIGTSATSTDGITWTLRSVPTVANLRGVKHVNGRFLTVGESGTMFSSADGVDWRLVGPFTGQELFQTAHGNGLYVAVGAGGSIFSSPDALAWTARPSGTAANLVDVVFAAGRFVAVAANGDIVSSRDGVAWQRRAGNVTALNAIAFAGGSFFALAAGSGYLVSPGAETWTHAQHGSAVGLNDVIEFKSRVIGVGGAGSVLAQELPGGVAGAGAARLGNLSVRTTLPANQVLTLGVTVHGGSRDVLIRAAGPVLGTFGIASAMANPRLDLFRGEQRIAENDNWPAALAPTFAALGAFPFPAASLDAALLQPLDGGHTIQARGPGSGVVLVEGYDAGTGGAGRLVNLSARNRAGTGTDTLIAGVFVGGAGTMRVLVRATGPALAGFGVPGTLEDPRLELYDSSGRKVAENDDWPVSLAGAFSSVGAFALSPGSRDSAFVATLLAGRTYTVQVSGAGGGTGEALIEIYELP